MGKENSFRPDKITLRAYQVGFGDCFLLTFHYNSGQEQQERRHVLIDFGTTAKPEGAPDDLRLLIANDIKKRCGGKLHAVVATHRHADHISGFATGGEGKLASGDIIRGLKPELVIQPWTEKWDASADAVSVSGETAFLSTLDYMSEVSSGILTEADRLASDKEHSKEIVDDLKFLGANNLGQKDLTNKSAVENLRTMSAKRDYLRYGDTSHELERILPNVKVYVLGPPDLTQTHKIRAQRSSDKDEFWQLNLFNLSEEDEFCELDLLEKDELWQLRVSRGAQSWKLLARTVGQVMDKQNPFFSGGAVLNSPEDAPPQSRWLIRRLNSLRTDRLFRIVRSLDSVLNNTSLILLFEVGDQKLLFPGDAQIENWSYALAIKPKTPEEEERHENTKRLLEGVTLYKVGHHGSRNATPRSLWEVLSKQAGDNRLSSVVSTRAGKHGNADDNTEVPRETLMQELRKFKFYTTEELVWKEGNDETPPHKDLKFNVSYG